MLVAVEQLVQIEVIEVNERKTKIQQSKTKC